jgi:stage IV sporulation protein FB
MRFSLTLGRVFGTTVRLHVTFLLVLAVIGGVAWAQGGAALGVSAVVFLASVFACVLLHEFGHILAARRYGVRTPDVVLLPIGGVARMERMPETPGQEIVVALAGPAVNVVIAACLLVALGGFPSFLATLEPSPGGLTGRLLYANLFIAAFNLVPAFPMDGGRVLRALLSAWRGHAVGTLVAARIGQGFAVLLGLAGLAGGNLLLPLVAVFIFLAAAAENRMAATRAAAAGIRAADAMRTQFATLGRDARLADAIERRLRTGEAEFVVRDGDGRPAGVLTTTAVFEALKARGADTPVVDVMADDVARIGAGDDLAEAVRRLQENNRSAVAVVDDGGRLVGLVTPQTLADLMAVERAGGGRRGDRPGILAPRATG